MRLLSAFAFLLASPAMAGGSPPASPFRTAAQVQAAMGGAVPQPCAAVPAADTLNGSTGSAGCFVPRDATRPTVVQAANVTTDANGAWSVTWARPFTSTQPVVNPLPVNTGTLPILCNVATRSGASASGKCWQSTATTLPATVTALVGLLISPFGTPASNASVMVIAREPTQ